MKRIVLLRHGRTEANDSWLYCGSTDLPLSPAGAAALVELRQEGGYPDITGMKVYTSGMRRTEETLRILYGDVEHSAAEALREMDFGAFEMHSYEQLKEDPVYRAWCDGDNESNLTPGGESGQLMRRRVLAGFDALCAENESFLLVSHGGQPGERVPRRRERGADGGAGAGGLAGAGAGTGQPAHHPRRPHRRHNEREIPRRGEKPFSVAAGQRPGIFDRNGRRSLDLARRSGERMS